MVFIQLPSQLSDEEKALQQKYAKLKRKKKLLFQHKTPKVEKPEITTQTVLKRAAESSKQDAKEVAKRLLKAGAIKLAKPPDKEREGQGFKRSKSLARKKIGADKPAGFKPFQPDPERETLPSTGFSMAPKSSSSGYGNSSSPTSSAGSGGPSSSWGMIAASYNRRGEPSNDSQDQREIVSYDDL
ncbi:negative elongation factor E [Tetranychus urticae]|uniref:Negative elongation factor E n=1 Tax=Tetranychus urticae TaxID=32264 RepID=T1KGN5_TETUR|nr:negative elongation factor E [Tetranychus urticae]